MKTKHKWFKNAKKIINKYLYIILVHDMVTMWYVTFTFNIINTIYQLHYGLMKWVLYTASIKTGYFAW